MKTALLAWLALPLGLLAATCRAEQNPEIVSLGNDTYSLTRWAETGFARSTAKLKAQALEDAAAYCAKMHKELKVVSTTATRPFVPLTGIAHAKVVFKALDANDPELRAPVPTPAESAGAPAAVASASPQTPTDTLYKDLLELDDLRKRGLLTEEEFQAKRKKLVESSR
jgi:Short C-terminal domain